MKAKIGEIKESAIKEIKTSENLQNLNDIRVMYLGKKGKLTEILRSMGGLSAEERPVIGSIVNEAREEI